MAIVIYLLSLHFLPQNLGQHISPLFIEIQALVGYIHLREKGIFFNIMASTSDKESQKKMIGELLRTADKFIKSAEWNKALEEVHKALAIEPNNMYAMAYKDRINVSIAEEKKKAEEEKVKKLAEEKKPSEKLPEPVKEKSDESDKKEKSKEKPAEKSGTDEKKETEPKVVVKEDPAQKGKDDSALRLESLRQEFTATQAKLQRDVAQLTMQVKEKEAAEKSLTSQISSLQQELTAAKQQAAKISEKEVEALKKEIEHLKARQQKDGERAKEFAQAESLAQVATLQKDIERLQKSVVNATPEKFGEELLKQLFVKAWADGTISNDERKLLEVVKESAKLSDAVFSEIESSSKSETYMSALRMVWGDGIVSTEESDFLATLREKLGIPAEMHFKLENQVRKELKK